MKKRITVITGFIIMCFCLLNGCADKGISFNVAYNDEGVFGSNPYGSNIDVLFIADSVQELKDSCNELSNPAFQEDHEYYESEVNQMIRGYDDSFFADKALIVMQFLGGNEGNGCSYDIKSLKVENNVLVIKRREHQKRGTWLSYGVSRIFLIEVSKTDIVGITGIEIDALEK